MLFFIIIFFGGDYNSFYVSLRKNFYVAQIVETCIGLEYVEIGPRDGVQE